MTRSIHASYKLSIIYLMGWLISGSSQMYAHSMFNYTQECNLISVGAVYWLILSKCRWA